MTLNDAKKRHLGLVAALPALGNLNNDDGT